MVSSGVVVIGTLLLNGGGGIVPRGSRVVVFSRIFDVFLLLGTLVGVVVIGYMSWKAYKYRGGADHVNEEDLDRPKLGELPTGSGGGRKLFVSFGISALIVISLIAWTYMTLLYVEGSVAAASGEQPSNVESQQFDVERTERLTVEVIGSQFDWQFVYPNGYQSGVLRVPRGVDVHLVVTSQDVFHNFGIPEFRVKTDAIPGQTTDTWFIANETGTYTAHCYELCGAGHSYMDAEVVVMEPTAFEQWYADTEPSNATADQAANGTTEGSHGHVAPAASAQGVTR